MTFTEAAVEVLRLVGRPLHYKKITEIAIAKNLLSHVGKAPDMTMSSRLATMIKKDRGDEPIIKVKPGVFGLREFSQEVLALADSDFEVDVGSLPDLQVEVVSEETEEVAEEGAAEAEAETERRPRPALPGSDVFPEEEDDDEPILGRLEEPATQEGSRANGASEGEEGKGRRRRRRRGRKGGEEGAPAQEARRSEPRQQEQRGRHERRERERLDMSRVPEDGDLVGQDLADAAYAVLEGQRPEPLTHARLAELLIRKGRLSGSPAALAPTLAAAIRADGIRRGAQGPRFRIVEGRVALCDWYLPNEAGRAERDARRAAGSQRDAVHRAFLRKIADLPTAAFAELMATWLNAEGIGALRAVRRPGSSGAELHLAGTLRRGQEEVRVAILVLRDGRDLRAERIVEVRGALHHYAQASMAWVITTARADAQARQEVEVAGAAPVVLFDGRALAAAMESRGVGLRAVALPLAAIDLDLLDTLRGEPEDLLQRDRDRDRDRDRARDERRREREQPARERAEEPEESAEEEAELESTGEEAPSAEPAAEEEPRRRRRRRRGGRKRRGEGAEGAEAEAGADEEHGEDGENGEHGADEDAAAAAEEPEESAEERDEDSDQDDSDEDHGDDHGEDESESDDEDSDEDDEDESDEDSDEDHDEDESGEDDDSDEDDGEDEPESDDDDSDEEHEPDDDEERFDDEDEPEEPSEELGYEAGDEEPDQDERAN